MGMSRGRRGGGADRSRAGTAGVQPHDMLACSGAACCTHWYQQQKVAPHRVALPPFASFASKRHGTERQW